MKLDLKPEAARPYVRLVLAAAELVEAGRPMPCQRDPGPWVSEDRHERAEAAQACSWCPLLDLCRTYADEQREGSYVWGGVDRTPKTAHPKKEHAA